MWFSQAHREDARGRAAERDEQRGYRVDMKRVVIAYTAEIVISAASLYGAWLFANTYGHDDPRTMAMMMLAPIGYAVIECCLVPLALSVRTHRSRRVRTLAVIGVLCAAGVTIKSMSQLGEIMFRPRLFDVVHAAEELQRVKAAQATIGQQIAEADALVHTRHDGLADAEQRTKSDAEQLAKIPAPGPCIRMSGMNRHGQPYQYPVCPKPDPRIATLSDHLQRSSDARAEASRELEKAVAARSLLDVERTRADNEVAKVQVEYREAILHSQLHSFSGMFFGVSPTEVTDEQISQFLRIFVFFPAICVAFASTLVAFTAVHTVKPKLIPFAPEGTDYLLNPIYQQVVDEAVRQVDAQHKADAEALGAHV
jgi:hypothetical protein